MNSTDHNPLVSILMPNHNKASYLAKTLNSVISQTYENWECIIIDDGSTDSSWEIINFFSESDKRIKGFHRPKEVNKGANTCRNLAFSKSIGEFVIFFDSDDILSKNCIENRVKSIQHSVADFVVFQGYYWDLKSDYVISISSKTSSHVIDDFFYFLPHWLSQSLIIRKEFLIKENIQWNPDTPCFQDIFFNLDLLSKQNNFEVKEETDWIWRKTEAETLGKKIYKVNTYEVNKQIANSYWNALVIHKKNNPFYFYQFCLIRFYNLLQSNFANGISLSPLLAYVDILKTKKVISWNKYYKIKAIALIGLLSNRYNIYIGKQIFFRGWKRIILSNYFKPINKHFLVNGVVVTNAITQYFEI